jgi:hypothetical protein
VTTLAVGISEIDIGVMVGRCPKVLYFEPEFQIERLRWGAVQVECR